MKLQGDFFNISTKNIGTDSLVYEIKLNAQHFIYQAHFPGNPVTPGVCLMKIIKELAGDYLQQNLFLQKISKIRFLNTINPLENEIISLDFNINPEENNYKISVTAFSGDITFAQMTLNYLARE